MRTMPTLKPQSTMIPALVAGSMLALALSGCATTAAVAEPPAAGGGRAGDSGTASAAADAAADAEAEPTAFFTRIAVDVDAPQPARGVVTRALNNWEGPAPPRDAFGTQRVVSEARRIVTDALATEGWFSPDVRIEDDGRRVRIAIVPGVRTVVSDVEIEFRGAVTDEAGRARREALRDAWGLKRGEPFRQDDWNEAKRRLLNELLAQDFASAQLADSRAEIDADAARARLRVVVDSGPRFTFGSLQIEGLNEYDRTLIERYARIRPGDPYRADALLTLQSALQNTPYFASVTVDVDRNPAYAQGVPVVVRVTETLPKRVGFGLGYSTNTGARGEVTYSNANFARRAWGLDSGVRVEQLRQLGFATLRLPPNRNDSRDSFTLLAERSDIQNLTLRRIEASAARALVRGATENRWSLNMQREWRAVPGAPERAFKALTANWSWTWRGVDNIVDPRRGLLVNFQVGGGARALLSDQNFVRAFVRAQHYWTVRNKDVFSVRAIVGSTFAPSREGIPQTFLFRTGGTTTVRGYAFESLGVREAGAVVGGRYTAVLGAEYVNWLTERWGAAAFVDAGNAVDRASDLRPVLGYGAGVRFRSPVGPLALDIAYGQDVRKVRAHVAIAVAF